MSLWRNCFYGVLWKRKPAEFVDFFYDASLFSRWWEKSELLGIFEIVPSSVHYSVLLSETFMKLQDASSKLLRQLCLQSETGTSKSSSSGIWKVVIDNFPKPFPITHANHLISQYSSTNRIIVSLLSFQTNDISAESFYLNRAWWTTLDEKKIAWNNHWECGKESSMAVKLSFIICRTNISPNSFFKAGFFGSWIYNSWCLGSHFNESFVTLSLSFSD